MKKNLILKFGILAIGIALLVLSLIPGVSSVSEIDRIRFLGEAGERYDVWAQATIETRGIFSLKEADVTFIVVDADNNVLVEETIPTRHTIKELHTTYTVNDFVERPADVLVEVHDVKFNNVDVIVLSSLIIVCSLIMIFFEIRKKS